MKGHCRSAAAAPSLHGLPACLQQLHSRRGVHATALKGGVHAIALKERSCLPLNSMAHASDTASVPTLYLNTPLFCSRKCFSLGTLGGRLTTLPSVASLVGPCVDR